MPQMAPAPTGVSVVVEAFANVWYIGLTYEEEEQNGKLDLHAAAVHAELAPT